MNILNYQYFGFICKELSVFMDFLFSQEINFIVTKVEAFKSPIEIKFNMWTPKFTKKSKT